MFTAACCALLALNCFLYSMKKIIVFSGAGMSAESGLKTFRDAGGLWEDHDVYQVATPEAWEADPGLVLRFYNMRRKQVEAAQPNAAHLAIARLQDYFDVQVITQNIDDLHERAGSKEVLHLHGEVMKVRGEHFPDILYPFKGELELGQYCPNGSQLRPHVVWFGEPVIEMENAAKLMSKADIVLTIGTSLNVYPAAGLLQYAPRHARQILVDPADIETRKIKAVEVIKDTASSGVPKVVDALIKSVLSV